MEKASPEPTYLPVSSLALVRGNFNAHPMRLLPSVFGNLTSSRLLLLPHRALHSHLQWPFTLTGLPPVLTAVSL